MSKTIIKAARIFILAGLLITSILAIEVQAETPRINLLEIKGIVNPVLADYISRGINQAEEDGALAVIIQMDTPGGLDTAMRDIIKEIVNAKVPVIVYVAPAGSRAASAGAFITLAAHVAVMAPGTAIGAATPVSLEGGEIPEDLKKKVLNDAVAYIKSLAAAHGRNVEWAEKAVREGISATEQEALELNVVDMIVPNLNMLITELNGREITLLGGTQVTLNTEGALIEELPMSWVEGFLYAITDPNIAYILLSMALLGLTVEITTPGIGLPGIAGGICLVIAFYSLGVLQVNYAGVILIVLAFALFIAEVFTTTFGLFIVGGLVSLITGSLILFRGGPAMRPSISLIITIAVIITALFAFVLQKAVKAHRRQPSIGNEELVGKSGIVKTALKPMGTILYNGERWNATLDEGQAKPGEEVTITKHDGLKLWVTKK